MKKILVVLAHPDDETFGPGATIAKYANEGVQVDILMATRGEMGENHFDDRKVVELGKLREEELRRADKILGVHNIEFMGFIDGELRQNLYFDIANKIIKKIKDFKPEIVITFEPGGVSGHLDHIAISFITTYAYLKTNIPKKLYYNCTLQKYREKLGQNYFVYQPDGYSEKEVTTKIDVSEFWDLKMKAMGEHRSQLKDVKRLKTMFNYLPKVDYYILKDHRLKNLKLPEEDLFNGIE
ncbi:hypothetical protein B6D29_03000 [Microgenomates bacterium UTCPR1]|nr:PIG-L family deacetylase [Patescibacteria group bacterium]OQY66230.1 MAG: hypothetical protein B6D29_03000 [Microgenomates bacterium UTCPR1]